MTKTYLTSDLILKYDRFTWEKRAIDAQGGVSTRTADGCDHHGGLRKRRLPEVAGR